MGGGGGGGGGIFPPPNNIGGGDSLDPNIIGLMSTVIALCLLLLGP